MAGQDPDDHDDEQSPSSAPWYNRTPAVIGASVAGLAVIGILIAAVTFVSRQSNEPEQAPLNFVEPSFSATTTGSSSTPTTTATITSTSPPVTTDIDGPSSTTSSVRHVEQFEHRHADPNRVDQAVHSAKRRRVSADDDTSRPAHECDTHALSAALNAYYQCPWRATDLPTTRTPLTTSRPPTPTTATTVRHPVSHLVSRPALRPVNRSPGIANPWRWSHLAHSARCSSR